MSRRVLNAHTGECLVADLEASDTFEDLKQWISKNTGIVEKKQVLLTPRGKQVKPQTLRNEEDIFVYDRDVIQGAASQETFPTSQDQHISFPDLESPPKEPTDSKNVHAWLDAAQARAEWAARFDEACRTSVDVGKRLHTESDVVQQGTAIAVNNLKQHLASLNQRYRQARDWVESLTAAQASFEEERGTLEARLSSIPATAQLQHFLKSRPGVPKHATSLVDLLGAANLDDLSARSKRVAHKLKTLIDEIGAGYEQLSERGGLIAQNFSPNNAASAADLLEALDVNAQEQGVLCKKVYEDCANILRNESGDPSQFAKVFARHDKNLIPPLMDTVSEIHSLVSKMADQKAGLVADAIAQMQKISDAESSIGHISQNFGQLELNAEDDATLESLDTIYRLPSAYGLLVIEVIRRREWTEKMTNDSTSLAEEMATYRDEEERRRKKWLKSVGHFIGNELGGEVMGIDVNIRAINEKLPRVSREEAATYIDALRNVGGFDEAVQELSAAFKAMDAPSKQQVKRANAFRNGSVSDAPFGRNSLLLRGDDDLIQSLQAEKSRLEERLKGSDSRVRKLEDLLHRQSQISSRPPSRGLAAGLSYERQVSTPTTLDGFSKMPVQPQSPGPYGSRRSSLVAQFHEHNPLAERVAYLEAELATEKTKCTRLEDAANKTSEKEESLRNQVQEATAMKKDLMDNFQAQQNEFEGERRLLEDENRKLKDKLEELEEDFDRIIGSHDNARIGLDERTKMFEQELRSHREKAAEELDKVTTENEKLKSEHGDVQKALSTLQLEQSNNKRAAAQAESRVKELEAALQENTTTQSKHAASLKAAHSRLTNDEAAPAELESLVEAMERLSCKAAGHLQDLQQALEKARLENASQNKQLETRMVENKALKSRFDQEELEVFSLREEVADRKARYASLEGELEDQRQDLENLRTKYSRSELVIQSLRDRVRIEEKKVTDLNDSHANTKSRHTQAENHLSRLNERVGILEDVRSKQTILLESKSRRAEEVSIKLYSQNQLLLKLLSQVGFTAARQNGTYTFERTSRLANGSTLLADLSPTVSRSAAGNPDSEQAEQDPSLIWWASPESSSNEAELFQEYMSEIDALRMDSVLETLVKRFKDVEYTARKWQREAKNYREKFHKTQFEAQNKIAFRTFKDGDLALFLPTRNQAPKRSWAAFNVGAPHYFLREQEHHTLKSRDWLVARISRVEERVVDLSKGMASDVATSSVKEGPAGADDNASITTEDENPFGLSDGLRWYYLDATEERLGAAPTTPGLGKSTVASAPEHATGSNLLNKGKVGEVTAAAKVLTKSLDSRRSSSNSKKSTAGALASTANATGTFDTGQGEGGNAAAAAAAAANATGPSGGVANDRNSLRRPGSTESTAALQQQAQQQQQQQQQEGRKEPQGWSSLWSLDVSLESGRKDGAK